MKNIIQKVLVVIAVVAMLPLQAVAEPSPNVFDPNAVNSAVSAFSAKYTPAVVEEVYTATFTAYNSEVGQTDSDPFIAANGRHVHAGMLACSRDIPFGASAIITFKSGKVMKGVCGDRMARKYDHSTNFELGMPHFDIWMASKSDAKQFGRQVATVTIRYEID